MNGADSPDSQDLVFKIAPGTDYGFPFCFNEGPPGGVGAQVHVVPNPRFNDAARCAAVPPATALDGWHTCTTGIDIPRGPLAPAAGAFEFPAPYSNSAYVGECGPFYPDALAPHIVADPTTAPHDVGHKVRRIVLDDQGNAVEVRDFLNLLALPTDVRFGPDGAMYVADVEGVLRVFPVLP
jgi:glucose/arabinose dehydrogenase